jgi:large subunit ribosomal protein L9
MAANVHVILARDVPNLGRIGDLVHVRPGYARNYLVPQGLALPASPKRVAEFEHKRKLVEHQRGKLRAASEARAQEIAQVQVTVMAKVGEQGKLFGSITNRDISNALAAEGHNIHHKDIKLDGPLKDVGLHVIDVRLEADVTTQIKVVVAPEKVEEPIADEGEELEAEAAEGEGLEPTTDELEAASAAADEAPADEAPTPEASEG